MPVGVKRLKGKYRVCECATGNIAKSVNGRPVDGGGHCFQAKAERQRDHINSAKDGGER